MNRDSSLKLKVLHPRDRAATMNRYEELALQLKEHRRILLELLITHFPTVLTEKPKEVAAWRKRLRVQR